MPTLSMPLIGRAAVAAAVASACVFAGGCTKDPLSISCKDFLALGSNDQMVLSAQMAAGDGKPVGATEKMMALSYDSSLHQYCGEDGHSGDKLKDLTLV